MFLHPVIPPRMMHEVWASPEAAGPHMHQHVGAPDPPGGGGGVGGKVGRGHHLTIGSANLANIEEAVRGQCRCQHLTSRSCVVHETFSHALQPKATAVQPEIAGQFSLLHCPGW